MTTTSIYRDGDLAFSLTDAELKSLPIDLRNEWLDDFADQDWAFELAAKAERDYETFLETGSDQYRWEVEQDEANARFWRGDF